LNLAIEELKQGNWVVSKWQHRKQKKAHLWVLISVENLDNHTYLKVFDPAKGLLRLSINEDLKKWESDYFWKTSLILKSRS
jgi:hypothetical protein